MIYKPKLRGVVLMMLLIMVSSFSFDAPVKRYTPVGSWEYLVPGVQEGYESGTMTISFDGDDFKGSISYSDGDFTITARRTSK